MGLILLVGKWASSYWPIKISRGYQIKGGSFSFRPSTNRVLKKWFHKVFY